MNKTIWKYPTPIKDLVEHLMPQGAHVLCVQLQRGVPTMWAIVDPEAPQETRRFRWFGTGHPLPDQPNMCYIDTIQIEDGALVFHLFAEILMPRMVTMHYGGDTR